jgi:hypothetical protein
MFLDSWPTCRQQDDNAYFPPGKILLVPEILVRRDERFESGCFSPIQQLPVFKLTPALLISCFDRVGREMLP